MQIITGRRLGRNAINADVQTGEPRKTAASKMSMNILIACAAAKKLRLAASAVAYNRSWALILSLGKMFVHRNSGLKCYHDPTERRRRGTGPRAGSFVGRVWDAVERVLPTAIGSVR